MKLGLKLFLSSILVLTVFFALGGYLLISHNFQTSVNREVDRSLEEHQSVKFMLQSGIISAKLQGEILSASLLENICRNVSGSNSSKLFSFTDEAAANIFSNIPKDVVIPRDLASPQLNQQRYAFVRSADGTFALVSSAFAFDNATYCFISFRDVSDVFADLGQQTQVFFWFDFIAVILSSGALYVLSLLLTRPIKQVAEASKQIAGGAYDKRVVSTSRDEIGELASSFNTMAEAVEEKINDLRLAAQQKEDFVANFAHELKTPLTSIIGYADLLRSRECDEASRFKALSYIFSEGKRLESLSLKLLELIVLNNQSFSLSSASVKVLFENITTASGPLLSQSDLQLKISVQDCLVMVEKDLIATLLLNLIDNARKASKDGGCIEIFGEKTDDTYQIRIQDHGIGIPEEDLARITEAFYTVDKSRARKQHGAGLGLSICERIAELHGTALTFASRPGEGTTVSFSLATAFSATRQKD